MVTETDRARIEKLLSVTRATRPLPAPDGSLFFASNREGHAQVYRQAAPGAKPELLIATETRMVPHAHTSFGLLVREDRGGNEVWQLGLITDGRRRALTEDARAIHQSVTLHPDGRRAGLGWNPDGQANVVLGEIDLASGALTPWVELGGYWRWGCWSPDGARAVVIKTMGMPVEGYILERDGSMIRLLPKALRVLPVEWLDQGILVVTDGGRDFFGLALVDPGRPDDVARWLLDEDHDVEGVTIDLARTKAALIVNDGVYDSLRVLELSSGRELDRNSLPAGIVVSDHSGEADYHMKWSPDGSRLFVSWERPTQPAEIYECPSGTRWTFTSEVPSDLIEPEETSYKGFEGLTIPALHFKIDDRPRPAVVMFHGGPESQWRGAFLPLAHLLNATGIDVFLPNVRGSTGYGIRYESLDNKGMRWNGVRDGSEAARYLKRSGRVTKVGAMGGSYGGFMTLAVLVDDPDLWDAGVETVGIADWHTFFRNMPPWRGVTRMSEYGDPNGAEADFLREISPIHRAASIKAPLLVIHGRNDARVPVAESIQISEAVAGSELLIFEDEGHGIVTLPNQVTANTRILEFLAEHLLS